MTIDYKEHTEDNIVELSISGKLTKQEYESVTSQLEAFIDKHGTVKILEVVHDFDGVDSSILWQGIKFDVNHWKNFSHCAVVTDEKWVSPFTNFVDKLSALKIKSYPMSDLEQARHWLQSH